MTKKPEDDEEGKREARGSGFRPVECDGEEKTRERREKRKPENGGPEGKECAMEGKAWEEGLRPHLIWAQCAGCCKAAPDTGVDSQIAGSGSTPETCTLPAVG